MAYMNSQAPADFPATPALLILMLEVLTFMFSGGLLGWLTRNKPAFLRWADLAAKPTLYCLLFLLGLKLGDSKEIMEQLGALGLQALIIGSFCTFLSALSAALLDRFYFRSQAHSNAQPTTPLIIQTNHTQSTANEPPATQTPNQAAHQEQSGSAGSIISSLISSLYILLAFSVGITISGLQFCPKALLHPSLVPWAFYFLLLCVGVGMGSDLRWVGILRQYSYKVLFIPLVVSLGTLAGGLLAALCLSFVDFGMILPDAPTSNLGLRDTLAVAAGFGYYSLSSLLLNGLAGPAVGSVALLANLLRELLSLVTLPLLVRWLGRMAPIGAGASTSMDTCLPLIAAHCGEVYGIMAVFSGMVLTLAVPLILPLFYSI